MIKSVCLFCGAGAGRSPAYSAAAEALGRKLARRGFRLVYGGGDSGLMGTAARSAFAAGAEVVGVIPRKLHALVAETDLTELIIVEDMRERKTRMHELSDAFVILPGGIGTLEEFFEAWSWRALGYHSKPIGILEVEGFWEPMTSFLKGVVTAGFLGQEHLDDLVIRSDPGELLTALESLPPPRAHKRPERGK
ncbi:MAG TPA: TIGR00730 family Rossman fold protein [Magnetospirillaceae bacterium]|nr:TIGR00730 family Rossman fold protein [Magnetospirillaceae bacterium]